MNAMAREGKARIHRSNFRAENKWYSSRSVQSLHGLFPVISMAAPASCLNCRLQCIPQLNCSCRLQCTSLLYYCTKLRVPVYESLELHTKWQSPYCYGVSPIWGSGYGGYRLWWGLPTGIMQWSLSLCSCKSEGHSGSFTTTSLLSVRLSVAMLSIGAHFSAKAICWRGTYCMSL